MNNFSVKTPDEWKNSLYLHIEQPKHQFNFKPMIVLAAVIAVIITSTTAFAYSRAPEYISSLFPGSSAELSQQIYSHKNIEFDSSSDEFSLICKGITGDKGHFYMILEMKSLKAFEFDPECTYFFENYNAESLVIPFNGLAISGTSEHIDSKTIEIRVGLQVPQGTNLIGRTVSFGFSGLTDFSSESPQIHPCEFSKNIKIDYPDTTVKFSGRKTVAKINEVGFKPKKATLSNLSIDIALKAVENQDALKAIGKPNVVANGVVKSYYADYPDIFYNSVLTLKYRDGTEESYDFHAIEGDGRISVSVSFDTDFNIKISGSFSKLINASEVVSVSIDGYELFAR